LATSPFQGEVERAARTERHDDSGNRDAALNARERSARKPFRNALRQ